MTMRFEALLLIFLALLVPLIITIVRAEPTCQPVLIDDTMRVAC